MKKSLGYTTGSAGKIASSQWDHIRTEHQVKAHEGYTPEAVHIRANGDLGAGREGGRTPILATPPDWTSRAGCTSHVELFGKCPSSYEGHRPEVIAEQKKICAACPVRQLCLEDAMQMEVPNRGDKRKVLAAAGRYLMRGGLTPRERHKLALLTSRKDNPGAA